MLSQLAYRLGQLVGLAVAAVVVLLFVALLVVTCRAAWWLITDHPLVAIGAALAGVLIGGRKL